MPLAKTISLCMTTGQAKIDQFLAALVGIFETAFPAQIRGYFICGSYAGKYQTPGSDLDIEILFQGNVAPQILKQAEKIAHYCDKLTTLELDIAILTESGYFKPDFMLGSSLLYGQDIRPTLKLEPIDLWIRDRMYAGCWLISHLFNRPGYIRLPLDYPQTEEEFYGYDDRPTRKADGTQENGTRNLIRATGWAATALIALKTNHYVSSKADCIRMYCHHINDEWTSHLEDIYQRCRLEWEYLIPAAAHERQALRDICRRNLLFENHYLEIYRAYLLHELRYGDTRAKQKALEFLKTTPFYDDEIKFHAE